MSSLHGTAPYDIEIELGVCPSNATTTAVVVALLGHTPNSISMSYGAVPWSELIRAVKLL